MAALRLLHIGPIEFPAFGPEGIRGEWIMRFWIAAMSVAGLLVSSSAALADKRVAFVVGNGAYKNVPALPNPAVDAKSMAKLLRNVGFEVVEGSNLSRDKMTEKLLDFGKKAEGADVARVLLRRPRHRGERHQLPAAGRCRPQIRNGRQAGRRHQYRPHARTDHGRCQGQAGVPRCLPRQSVRGKDPFRQGHPQRQRADRSWPR